MSLGDKLSGKARAAVESARDRDETRRAFNARFDALTPMVLDVLREAGESLYGMTRKFLWVSPDFRIDMDAPVSDTPHWRHWYLAGRPKEGVWPDCIEVSLRESWPKGSFQKPGHYSLNVRSKRDEYSREVSSADFSRESLAAMLLEVC